MWCVQALFVAYPAIEKACLLLIITQPPHIANKLWRNAVLLFGISSVARGGYSPPIGMSTEMQNGKNITFLALLRLFYALEWTK